MSNRDLYKRSFHKLQPSEQLRKELQTMTHHEAKRRRPLKRMLPLIAAVTAILATTLVASATGAMDQLRLWINCKEVEASQNIDESRDIVVVLIDEAGTKNVIISNGDDQSQPLPDTDIIVEYVQEGGQDMLRFRDVTTGQSADVVITLVNGSFDGTVEALNHVCQVNLTVAEDGYYDLSLSTEA